ncbi:hypothetical protein D187_004055 [Cystobacter fuscus DSM 2262]|uniref:Uncharacterized protein n=1 Tax=Cystobacter fuscus (strain ATCC 25194 / DSM 2262 / NBRC 100088 / M29) TaxID=1242864 RepID=S9QAD8_CYSF2|nr:hypothetical protein D187_004055 [Cystobacter fuscus DSM 2262]
MGAVQQTEGEEQQRESAHPATPASRSRRVNRDRSRGPKRVGRGQR